MTSYQTHKRMELPPMISSSGPIILSDFDSSWYGRWASQISGGRPPHHRKLWEHAVILQVFRERLWYPRTEGKQLRCLGLGVGRDPIASMMISYARTSTPPDGRLSQRLRLVLTDLQRERVNPSWIDTGQHASELKDTVVERVVSLRDAELVSEFHALDMADIAKLSTKALIQTYPFLASGFDFIWSSGSFEHIGGLDVSTDFFVNQLTLLNPGGWAVHTTELACDPSRDYRSTKAFYSPDLCIFSPRDIGAMLVRAALNGYFLLPLDLRGYNKINPRLVDKAPYEADPHIVVELDLNGRKVWTTSVSLVAQRGMA